MLTLALLTLILITLLAFQTAPEAIADHCYESRSQEFPEFHPVACYGPLSGWAKRFLKAYAHSLLILFVRLLHPVQLRSQICLLLIRQALATMHFGRGLLHS